MKRFTKKEFCHEMRQLVGNMLINTFEVSTERMLFLEADFEKRLKVWLEDAELDEAWKREQRKDSLGYLIGQRLANFTNAMISPGESVPLPPSGNSLFDGIFIDFNGEI